MKRFVTIGIVIVVVTGIPRMAEAQLGGRLAGRDVEVSVATIASQSQERTLPLRLPPNSYFGIELLRTTEGDLFSRLSQASLARLRFGSGEVPEGYCYRSSHGVYVAFSLYAFAQFDAIELSRDSLGSQCTDTSVDLDECIGPYCLGQTRIEVERQLGIELGKSSSADDTLEVAYFNYSAPMSAAERKKFEQFNLSEVPVKHNLWFRFRDERLYYIGVWRWEDLP